MNTSFEDYVNNGTKHLQALMSSPDLETEERKLVIDSFTKQLREHICASSDFVDYEYLTCSVSLVFVDGEVASVLSNPKASFNDCEKAIKFCEREKELVELFEKKRWGLPNLLNPNLLKNKADLLFRQSEISASARVLEADAAVNVCMSRMYAEYSLQACDDALEAVKKLEERIAACKKQKITVPTVHNTDTKELVSKIGNLRKEAKRKEEIHKYATETDEQIHNILTLSSSTPAQWKEMISLCRRQSGFFNECKVRQWPLPSVQHDKFESIEDRYTLYEKMGTIDNELSSTRWSLRSDAQYRRYIGMCAQQDQYIKDCKRKKWELPALVIENPQEMSEDVSRELRGKHLAWEQTKKYIKVGLIAAAVLVVIIIGIHLYRKGRVKIPFNPTEVAGAQLKDVISELEKAGFTNITKLQDYTGWMDADQVISVSIDDKQDYVKDDYHNPDVKVVVTYSSSDRVYVTDLLKEWKSSEPEDVKALLEKAGFDSVDLEELYTPEIKNDKKIANLVLNGKSFSDEECYLPKNAPIQVSYYIYKIAIGNDNAGFVGQNYRDVGILLEEIGFTNCQCEVKNTGFAKGESVVNVIVNGNTVYDAESLFVPDTSIVIEYSSNDRYDATSTISHWKEGNKDSLVYLLESAGFTNIIPRENDTEDLSVTDWSVSGLSVNSEVYTEGECYIQKNAPIIIDYYRIRIHIGTRLGDYDEDKKMKYKSVVEDLENMGFTNIRLYRNNALTTGWVDSEGSIASFYIDGKAYRLDGKWTAKVSGAEPFYRDVPIEIVVNTKKKGCDEITEYKEK